MKTMVLLEWPLTSDPRSEIIRRLHCAAGQIHVVIQMTEAGQPCNQILHQLSVVHAVLRTAAVMIIECQARSNQDVILNSTSVTERIAALQKLQSLYEIFVKQFSTKNEVNDE